MERRENRGVIIILMGIIIVILAVLCVLFATGKLSFNVKVNDSTISKENQEVENVNTDNNEEVVMSKEEALSKVKEVYKKFNDFDSISLPLQFCGDSELNNPNNDPVWYVKSNQFKNKEEAYSYYNTFVARELINKKVSELESQYSSAFLEKDGALYCLAKAAGGFNSEIIDDKTTYVITEVTATKILFTGNITKYEGYDEIGQPYNIEASLELVNGNWIVTKNIKK